jgi:hypothetical protein
MFKFRFLTLEDFDNHLLKWWKDNRFPAPPKDFLPNNGLDGIIVFIEDVPICAGFIYQTSAKEVAWLEFIVSNFEIKDKTIRKDAIDYLIKKLIEVANKKYIFTSVKNTHLIKHFQNNNFVIGSTNTTEMIHIKQ